MVKEKLEKNIKLESTIEPEWSPEPPPKGLPPPLWLKAAFTCILYLIAQHTPGPCSAPSWGGRQSSVRAAADVSSVAAAGGQPGSLAAAGSL